MIPRYNIISGYSLSIQWLEDQSMRVRKERMRLNYSPSYSAQGGELECRSGRI